MDTKGRRGRMGARNPLRGEQHPCAKLTDAQVVALREYYKKRPALRKGRMAFDAELGIMFGVSRHTVRQIGSGEKRA